MKAAGQAPETEGVRDVIGVCIECAVRNHHFRQGIGFGGRNWPEMSLYEAWLDGRHYTLLPGVGGGMWCRECHRRKPSIYVPSE